MRLDFFKPWVTDTESNLSDDYTPKREFSLIKWDVFVNTMPVDALALSCARILAAVALTM